MIQAGGLVVGNVTPNQVEELGLVKPPESMMVRPDTKKAKQKQEGPEFGSAADYKEDSWAMYRFSYRVL